MHKYQIKKMRADQTVDFAAEELKKYLRMMMPECGDISITYEPNATEGFRLGLAEDFDLRFDGVTDPVLDDVVHIETDEKGGILTGSNPRSVLFAVYRYLKENGCRWLYPGVDGEFIPVTQIKPVCYHHMADHQFRGFCNEGAEYQQCMLETIDFYPKLEMNVYMLEHNNPYCYYNPYYAHEHNESNRLPEMLPEMQTLQWKRQCEVEIAKRGLQFHDMGHGWTATPFGIHEMDLAKEIALSDEIRSRLAMINGERGLSDKMPINTNLCMSQPEIRTTMVKAIADYAQSHENVTYLHIWLADGFRNHCECEDCRKKRPSDFYMMIMNELDEELTRRNLDTRIVFIAYVDTMYAPREDFLVNPKRFALLYAPIQRSYTSSVDMDKIAPAPEYVRNHWPIPASAEENAAFLLDWQKNWRGTCFCYEYHFWTHFFRDPGTMAISRRIYEDVLSMKPLGLKGIVEDGSQRAFFPNGFAVYILAETLLNRNCDYEKVKQDYFSHIYGEYWQEAEAYLQQISKLFDPRFLEEEMSVDPEKSKYYAPEHMESLKKIPEVTAKERAFALAHMRMPVRAQSVSMRLLLRHAEFCELLADAAIVLAQGDMEGFREKSKYMADTFGRHEYELERYYDHYLCMKNLSWVK